jgi:hypothetical protein
MASDPSKHHGLLIALGLGPKSSGSAPPSSTLDRLSAGRNTPQANPTQAPTPTGNQGPAAGGDVASIRKQSNFKNCEAMCGNCTYWTRETGNCEKGNGDVDAGDTCDLYEDVRPGAGEDQDSGSMNESEPDSDDLSAILAGAPSGGGGQPSGMGG